MTKHATRKKGPASKPSWARRQALAAKAQWEAPYMSRGLEHRIKRALSVTETDRAGGTRDERDREEPVV